MGVGQRWVGGGGRKVQVEWQEGGVDVEVGTVGGWGGAFWLSTREKHLTTPALAGSTGTDMFP